MHLRVPTLPPRILRSDTKPVLVFSGPFPAASLFHTSRRLCLVALWVTLPSAIFASCIPKSSSALDHDNIPRLIVETFALATEIVRFPFLPASSLLAAALLFPRSPRFDSEIPHYCLSSLPPTTHSYSPAWLPVQLLPPVCQSFSPGLIWRHIIYSLVCAVIIAVTSRLSIIFALWQLQRFYYCHPHKFSILSLFSRFLQKPPSILPAE
ncbi:hypothetical protein LZ32DRAFT_19783 [Colletotrichum eremochloae]|nr:hypothetical protein LZ32DRAFT_19783 [Colletotrichum eremochloae]